MAHNNNIYIPYNIIINFKGTDMAVNWNNSHSIKCLVEGLIIIIKVPKMKNKACSFRLKKKKKKLVFCEKIVS